MKILVISNLFPPNVLGGYEVGCASIVSELAARGHHVTVLTSQSRHDFPIVSDSGIKTCLRLWNIYEYGICGLAVPEITQLHASAIDPINISSILRELSTQQYDVVYCFNLLGLGAMAICDTMTGLDIPWVWHIMDSIPSQMMSSMRFEVAALFQSASRRSVSPSKTFVMSKRLLSEIESSGVSIGGDVSIIPGWADDLSKSPRHTKTADGRRRFVAIGVLSLEKGTDLLLQTVSELPDEIKNSVFIEFFGRGDIHRYQAEARRLNIADCVRFHGQRPHREILEALPGFRALLFPTWTREPFGFVALEAAIGGVLPVFTKGIGASEILQDRVHALHIDRSIKSLKAAIVWVVENDEAASAIGLTAQTLVRQKYTLGHMTDRIEEHLKSIATGASISPATAERFNNQARFKYSLACRLFPDKAVIETGQERPSINISDAYAALKVTGRRASRNFLIKWMRSGLLKLLRPYLFEILTLQHSSRADIDALRRTMESGASKQKSTVDDHLR